MRSRRPHHPIADVRASAARGAVRFLYARAGGPLEAYFRSPDAARAAATAALEQLDDDDFVETVLLPPRSQPADVYGVVLDGRDWYVKLFLTIDLLPPNDDLVVWLSFHYPERAPKAVTARAVWP